MRALTLLCLALLAAPAGAATRGYSITSFEKIRVVGPFTVNVRTGVGPSARAEGAQRAIDQLRIEVQAGTLIVSADRGGAWGGWQGDGPGPVVITVTTPALSSASLSGSGTLSIDRVRSPRFDLFIMGSGEASLAALTTDRLTINVTGSGTAKLAGKALQVRALVQGTGGIAGAGLTATDLDATLNGSGDVSLGASRSAKVKASGSGNVDIVGDPACMVNASGSGSVRCGKGG